LAARSSRDQCALQSKPFRLHVDLLPTARDQLFEALNKGYGDAIAANLTITPERLPSSTSSIRG